MKTLLYCLIVVCCFATTTFAAPGDQPSDHQNAMWYLTASAGYTQNVLDAMNPETKGRYIANTAIEKDSFAYWLQIETANGALKTVYPLKVYYALLEHIEGYAFKRSRLKAASLPPGSPAVKERNITCASDTTKASRQARLYLWDYTVFTETEIVGTLKDDLWTFENVPAGVYVIAFERESLPTTFLPVEQ